MTIFTQTQIDAMEKVRCMWDEYIFTQIRVNQIPFMETDAFDIMDIALCEHLLVSGLSQHELTIEQITEYFTTGIAA